MRRTLAIALTSVAILSTPIAHAQLVGAAAGAVFSAGVWLYDNNEKTYYIEVQGQGRTPDEALNNGFRIAVEQALGTIIASETEVNNSKIARDEIISYASGYVNRYTVVKQDYEGGGVKTTMKVWVKRNPIANRLLAESKNQAEVEGPQVAAASITIKNNYDNGDQLLASVLRDYSRQAFDISIDRTALSMDNNRQTYLEIPMYVSWNKQYLSSLFTVLKAGAIDRGWFCDRKCAYDYVINGYHYSDRVWYNAVGVTLANTKPNIEVTILDTENKPVYRKCFEYGQMTGDYDFYVADKQFWNINEPYKNIQINSAMRLKVIAPVKVAPGQLGNAQRVEARVIPAGACRG